MNKSGSDLKNIQNVLYIIRVSIFKKVISQNFRNDKFGTLENFIYYIEENWFECNKFSYDECEENDGIYIIKVSVVNAIQEDDNSKSIPKTFAMKLKNKTDFVMSFNVD